MGVHRKGRRGNKDRCTGKAWRKKASGKARTIGNDRGKIPTSAEFSREYLTYIKDVKQNRSARRTRQALKHFSLLFGNKKLSEITPENSDTYKGRRFNEAAKPAHVNREFTDKKILYPQPSMWHKFFGDNPVS